MNISFINFQFFTNVMNAMNFIISAAILFEFKFDKKKSTSIAHVNRLEWKENEKKISIFSFMSKIKHTYKIHLYYLYYNRSMYTSPDF